MHTAICIHAYCNYLQQLSSKNYCAKHSIYSGVKELVIGKLVQFCVNFLLSVPRQRWHVKM